MHASLIDLYQSKKQFYSNDLHRLGKKIKIVSFARLITATAIILSFYFALTAVLALFYLFFLLIIIFAALVIIHSDFFKRKQLLQNFIQINTEEESAINRNFSCFESGKEFIDHNHSYSYDLDIFGANSIFQLLCRTITYNGKLKLASLISDIPTNQKEIKERQDSIRELKDKIDFRQKFRAHGLLLQESKEEKLHINSWLEEENKFTNTFLRVSLFILPIITLGALIYAIYKFEWNIVLILSIAFNIFIYSKYGKSINSLHQKISKKKQLLETYSELIKVVEIEKFNYQQLQTYHDQLSDASVQFKSLANYVGWLDYRLNVLFSPAANLFFLYDLHWCIAIEQWKEKNKNRVASWIDILSDIDSLNSLANYSFNNPSYSFPEFSDKKHVIKATGIYHPLLNSTTAITNDFQLGIDDKSVILTGANMAGKSTFLRTLGTNLVIAYSGAPVAATYFEISIMYLLSSMRISDSLKDHTSYFYAELQRLKFIKNTISSGKPSMILLDEMLKGTNSNDKQKGSKAFVESLLPYDSISIVATHDLELGKLETEYPSMVKNYCFESYLAENHLSFDYKIKSGMAQNTNASFLMKDLGII